MRPILAQLQNDQPRAVSDGIDGASRPSEEPGSVEVGGRPADPVRKTLRSTAWELLGQVFVSQLKLHRQCSPYVADVAPMHVIDTIRVRRWEGA